MSPNDFDVVILGGNRPRRRTSPRNNRRLMASFLLAIAIFIIRRLCASTLCMHFTLASLHSSRTLSTPRAQFAVMFMPRFPGQPRRTRTRMPLQLLPLALLALTRTVRGASTPRAAHAQLSAPRGLSGDGAAPARGAGPSPNTLPLQQNPTGVGATPSTAGETRSRTCRAARPRVCSLSFFLTGLHIFCSSFFGKLLPRVLLPIAPRVRTAD